MTRTPAEARFCAVERAKREMRSALAVVAGADTPAALEYATIAYAAASRRLEQAQRSAP
jgi:hypothetical protein